MGYAWWSDQQAISLRCKNRRSIWTRSSTFQVNLLVAICSLIYDICVPHPISDVEELYKWTAKYFFGLISKYRAVCDPCFILSGWKGSLLPLTILSLTIDCGRTFWTGSSSWFVVSSILTSWFLWLKRSPARGIPLTWAKFCLHLAQQSWTG